MQTIKTFSLVFFCLLHVFLISAQSNQFIPDLSGINDPETWVVYNRNVTYSEKNNEIYINDKPGDGIVWLKEYNFSNGVIEVDIKGKNIRGRSFVGIAFHGSNDSTFDAIYFRPFNFKNPDRKGHSVQYISHPEYTWYKLREEHPEEYENPVNPVPEPAEWFHATITVDFPSVKVFVNGSKESSLSIDQLSTQEKGWVGFWVGNNSDGTFKNLKILY